MGERVGCCRAGAHFKLALSPLNTVDPRMLGPSPRATAIGGSISIASLGRGPGPMAATGCSGDAWEGKPEMEGGLRKRRWGGGGGQCRCEAHHRIEERRMADDGTSDGGLMEWQRSRQQSKSKVGHGYQSVEACLSSGANSQAMIILGSHNIRQ